MSFYKNIPLIKPEFECIGMNNIEYKIGDVGWFWYKDDKYIFEVRKNTTRNIYLPNGDLDAIGQCVDCIFSKYNLCNGGKCKPICPDHQTFIEL